MIDISNLSDIEAYQLWENGLHYRVVVDVLASKDDLALREELSEQQQTFLNQQSEAAASKGATIFDLIETFTGGPHKTAEYELKYRLHQNVMRAIHSERLLAMGFNSPRKIESRPIVIPPDIIADGKNSFDSLFFNDRRIKKGDIKIEEVCFVWRKHVDQTLKNPPTKTTEQVTIELQPNQKVEPPAIRSRPGRPSTAPLIKRAFLECLKQGLIDFSRHKKDAAQIVRAYIQSHYEDDFGNGKGFDEQTILKHTTKEFDSKALKNNRI